MSQNMHTQALNDIKRPANIREFFVQSAIVRSSAIVDRMAQLEKLVYKITCAECNDVLSVHTVRSRCRCGYSYCSIHLDCCIDDVCIKCKPDLADYCHVCSKKKIVKKLICQICNRSMCKVCTAYRNHNMCYLCVETN